MPSAWGSGRQTLMHNTCLPLDLLFVDDDGFLVGVAESAPVLDAASGVPCPRLTC